MIRPADMTAVLLVVILLHISAINARIFYVCATALANLLFGVVS